MPSAAGAVVGALGLQEQHASECCVVRRWEARRQVQQKPHAKQIACHARQAMLRLIMWTAPALQQERLQLSWAQLGLEEWDQGASLAAA